MRIYPNQVEIPNTDSSAGHAKQIRLGKQQTSISSKRMFPLCGEGGGDLRAIADTQRYTARR